MEKLYQATSRYSCAGFVTKDDYVYITAPIIRKHISSKHITTAMIILSKLGYKVIEVKGNKK
jgi:hypothetical protein